MNMDDIQKSKVDAFIPQNREHAYYTEKTRHDYLRECSEYYDKYLNDFLMKEKCFWMRNEKMKVGLDHENAEEHVKNCRQQEPEEQENKRKSTGRPRGRPPKKQKMYITMEGLRMKASDPFGAKRGKKVKSIDSSAAE